MTEEDMTLGQFDVALTGLRASVGIAASRLPSNEPPD